ncbi:hypothetical protein [Qipengyuania marisflavi]|uniref:Uncharacterized protein n=1 Tax=Qipengyuania marisflavi TaxID=2486356 RepID=A0A5S3PYJ9_9SPHN|nr:hypothetical protein [Qipengyuania marisflavi]TMM48886.1 hypothetical protein FEV51_05725 [Qipengyuania marisflavi]
MASAWNRFILFFLYWVAPGLTLLMIIFGGEFRIIGYVTFGALFVFFLVRGKDYQGNPTVLGIRRGSSWLGNQRQASQGKSTSDETHRAAEHSKDE